MEVDGKGAAANKQLQHRVGKKKGGPPPGPPLAEPSILREGEADILLHGNDVFYNKAQVYPRIVESVPAFSLFYP